jgi:very-short-patch-repair endonuclease
MSVFMASLVAIVFIAVVAVGILRAITDASGPLGDGAESSDKGLRKKSDDWPVYCKLPLTRPEQVLYFRLREALPEHVILAQVSMSRFIGVKRGHNFQSIFNRYNRMTVDYLICNKGMRIIAVVELDDASHVNRKREDDDRKKDEIVAAAGLRMIRWNVKDLPDAATIAQLVRTIEIVSGGSGVEDENEAQP